jgi:hypothetical protein
MVRKHRRTNAPVKSILQNPSANGVTNGVTITRFGILKNIQVWILYECMALGHKRENEASNKMDDERNLSSSTIMIKRRGS